MNANIKSLEIAGVITAELLDAITNAPKLEPKDLYVEQVLSKLFFEYNWTNTFSHPVAIVYDEVIPSEILIILHKWLRRQCSNIENVYLITTHHAGISAWWDKWCDCFSEKSFKIIELCFNNSVNSWSIDDNIKKINLKNLDYVRENKKISKLFSFYGGTYATFERNYLFLRMLEFQNVATVDFYSDLLPKQELLDYVENITYYKNQNEVDLISKLYDQAEPQQKSIQNTKVLNTLNIKDFRKTQWQTHQWTVDKNSWATVIRETINSDFFPTVTEKTLMACLNHTALIPLGINAVKHLENLGFWFPHDIIDYSYQHEPLFAERVNKVCNILQNLNNKDSMSLLETHYFDNLQKFHYNAQLAYDLINSESKLKTLIFAMHDMKCIKN